MSYAYQPTLVQVGAWASWWIISCPRGVPYGVWQAEHIAFSVQVAVPPVCPLGSILPVSRIS